MNDIMMDGWWISRRETLFPDEIRSAVATRLPDKKTLARGPYRSKKEAEAVLEKMKADLQFKEHAFFVHYSRIPLTVD